MTRATSAWWPQRSRPHSAHGDPSRTDSSLRMSASSRLSDLDFIYFLSVNVSLRLQLTASPVFSPVGFPSTSTYAFARALTGPPSCLGLSVRSRPRDHV